MSETIYTYQGRGEWITGIPARDLTEGDWAALSEGQHEAVMTTPTADGTGRPLYAPTPSPRPVGGPPGPLVAPPLMPPVAEPIVTEDPDGE